jgi:hypothetical protein
LEADGKAILSYITSEFNDIYERIAIIMNGVRSKIGEPPSMYHWGITQHGHERKLVHGLESAMKYFEEFKNSNKREAV